MKNEGFFDVGGDPEQARLNYIHGTKAASHALGDEEGFKVYWNYIAWHGDRPDQGAPVDEQEAVHRWRECSQHGRKGVRAYTLGSLKKELERQYGWTQASMHTERQKTAQKMFASVVAPEGITPPDAAGAAAMANFTPPSDTAGVPILAADSVPTPTPKPEPAKRMEHFLAFLPDHSYRFLPTGAKWVKETVNAILPWPPMFNDKGLPVTDSKGNQKYLEPSLCSIEIKALMLRRGHLDIL